MAANVAIHLYRAETVDGRGQNDLYLGPFDWAGMTYEVLRVGHPEDGDPIDIGQFDRDTRLWAVDTDFGVGDYTDVEVIPASDLDKAN